MPPVIRNGDQSCAHKSFYRLAVAAAFISNAILLVVVVQLNRDQINPDAICYIRIGHYYVTGQTGLMISGYWSPMLSWLIAAWLLVVDDALLAARVAIAISAIIFLFGSFCVFRASRLPRSSVVMGTWTIALISASYSAAVITPDLLMGGIMCVGISMMLSRLWPTNSLFALCTGLVLGTSYLAKAVALPVSVLSMLGFATIYLLAHRISLQEAARGVVATAAGLLIVAGPWIGVISHKYGYLTFSTVGPIAHAVLAPSNIDETHPLFKTFHKPEAGRITSWEDPTTLTYDYWSPTESVGYAFHQAKIVYSNAHSITYNLKRSDLLGLGVASAILGFFCAWPWRRALRDDKWRLALIPIACLSIVYLPVYAKEPRYYWAAIPFLMVSGFGLTLFLSSSMKYSHRVKRAVFSSLVAVSFLIGNELYLRYAFNPIPNWYYTAAKSLAEKRIVRQLPGPVASIGGMNYKIGYYLAYLLGVPWFGHMQEVDDVNEALSSGALWIVVPSGYPLAKKLRDSTQFRSVGCIEEGEKVPFEIFLARPDLVGDSCEQQ